MLWFYFIIFRKVGEVEKEVNNNIKVHLGKVK